MTYLTISISCKIHKLLINYHILNSRIYSAFSSASQLSVVWEYHYVPGLSLSRLRHSGNASWSQLSRDIEIIAATLREKKNNLSRKH